MPAEMSRPDYAATFGPTVGDRVRLADTSLHIQVERDLTTYGEEVVFGAGKVIRDGMGQGQTPWAEGAPDTVLTNVLIFDHTGIVKADVSLRDGIITAIGKAGNPATQPEVTIPIGPGTEIIAGEGKILTAGGVDADVRFVGPQQVEAALAAGLTTLLGGGIGPTGAATAATPGAWHIGKMIDAADAFAVNIGFAGKGNASRPGALLEQLAGGACALALHDSWGVTPAAIDCCLEVADEHDVQVVLHADRLNESGFTEDLIDALKGRTVHLIHTAGSGGRAADLMTLAGLANVLPSSAQALRPAGGDGHAGEFLDEAIADADVLHDIGALSMTSSGAEAMGLGDLIRRTWQAADRMKRRRGPLAGDGAKDDNARAKRYIAKYTINPAIAHGIAAHVGSVEIGKLADLVLWTPAFFGVKPDLVLKGGVVAAALGGEAQPALYRPMFGALAGARVGACLTFVSQLALDKGIGLRLRTQRRLVAVQKTRGEIGKQSMIHNETTPVLCADPDTAQAEADGEAVPAAEGLADVSPEIPPMAQRYFLF